MLQSLPKRGISMIAMSADNPATAVYTKNIDKAVELVPGARAPYAENDLETTLARLRDAHRATTRDAQVIRKQAAAVTGDAAEALIEEAEDIEAAGHVINRGVLVLDLCNTQDPTY
jgi:hypothetical protein